eukprot:1510-Heterococcus_DN1.PRE.2
MCITFVRISRRLACATPSNTRVACASTHICAAVGAATRPLQLDTTVKQQCFKLLQCARAPT